MKNTFDPPPTLLEAATLNDFSETENLLNQKIPEREKNIALLNAAFFGYSKIVNLLLTKGANANYQNASGQTACMFAAANSHLEIINILHKYNAKINLTDSRSENALSYATNKEISARLISLGAKPPIKNEYKVTFFKTHHAKDVLGPTTLRRSISF